MTNEPQICRLMVTWVNAGRSTSLLTPANGHHTFPLTPTVVVCGSYFQGFWHHPNNGGQWNFVSSLGNIGKAFQNKCLYSRRATKPYLLKSQLHFCQAELIWLIFSSRKPDSIWRENICGMAFFTFQHQHIRHATHLRLLHVAWRFAKIRRSIGPVHDDITADRVMVSCV